MNDKIRYLIIAESTYTIDLDNIDIPGNPNWRENALRTSARAFISGGSAKLIETPSIRRIYRYEVDGTPTQIYPDEPEASGTG